MSRRRIALGTSAFLAVPIGIGLWVLIICGVAQLIEVLF